jgi:5'-methylthioadenosine phosphorylase
MGSESTVAIDASLAAAWPRTVSRDTVPLAGVTDYDVWHDEETVSLETVLGHAAANEASMATVLSELIETLPDEACTCHRALADAINTPAEAIDRETRKRVSLLVDDYL